MSQFNLLLSSDISYHNLQLSLLPKICIWWQFKLSMQTCDLYCNANTLSNQSYNIYRDAETETNIIPTYVHKYLQSLFQVRILACVQDEAYLHTTALVICASLPTSKLNQIRTQGLDITHYLRLRRIPYRLADHLICAHTVICPEADYLQMLGLELLGSNAKQIWQRSQPQLLYFGSSYFA